MKPTRKQLLGVVFTLCVTSVAIYLALRGQDQVAGQEAKNEFRPKLIRPESSESPPKSKAKDSTSTDVTGLQNVPAGWSPFTSSSLTFAPDLATRLELTQDQILRLESVRTILLGNIKSAFSQVEYHTAKVSSLDRKSKLKSAAETLLFLPAQPTIWAKAEARYVTGLEAAIGIEKAEVFRRQASNAILALTGDFGKQPQTASISYNPENKLTPYKWTVQTGPASMTKLATAQFDDPGLSLQVLERAVAGSPQSIAAESFAEIPNHLSTLLEAGKKQNNPDH